MRMQGGSRYGSQVKAKNYGERIAKLQSGCPRNKRRNGTSPSCSHDSSCSLVITASALPVIGSLPSRDCYLLPGQVTDSTVFWCSSRTVAQIDDGANVLTEQTTRASRNIELKSPS
ncbi:hypothetical protein V1477_015926 [Vespula maculifrons]|uniref:Uncharacterized protein n=2 Tax=Vespula TaxID=7451 RepID=A0A834NBH5_VESGE|nr:hypothetical protein HZH68_007163 [Vespula germanica]